jgi:hypothetical protein
MVGIAANGGLAVQSWIMAIGFRISIKLSDPATGIEK